MSLILLSGLISVTPLSSKELKKHRITFQRLLSYDVVGAPGFTDARFTYEKETEKKEYSDIDPYGEEDWEN